MMWTEKERITEIGRYSKFENLKLGKRLHHIRFLLNYT